MEGRDQSISSSVKQIKSYSSKWSTVDGPLVDSTTLVENKSDESCRGLIFTTNGLIIVYKQSSVQKRMIVLVPWQSNYWLWGGSVEPGIQRQMR